MKKAMLGFIASAMSLLATTAQAGDIRSIDPCDQYGYVIDNGSMAQPYTAGQTAYFRIRLENMNSRESWETKDTSKLSNPWRFQYTGIGVDSALEWAINPPKVGVYVSGQLRGATVVSVVPPADKAWYTDILCSYTVRPGDLALPMTLANQAGKEMGDGSASEYYLDTIPRSGAWRLMAYERESASTWDTVVATNTCTFKYGETQFFNANASAASEMTEWTTDYALKQAGLYVKSVDFTASEYSVGQGRTEKVNIGIVGGVNTNGNGTVYAMIKDGDAVALAEDSVEVVTVAEDPNGDTDVAYQVAKVTIPSGEDVDSFSFKVRGVTQGAESIVYLSTTKSFAYGDSHDLVTNFVTAVVKCVEPPPPYISVTLDGAASKSVTSGPDYTDYAAKLTVTLSEAHTSDVTVDVTPKMVSGNGADPLGKYIGMSTYSENGFLEKVTAVTFTAAEMAGGTLSKDLYVYVLGADDQTDGVGKGIIFKAANVAIFNNENVSAILYIKKSVPQILYPTENYSYDGLAGGVSSTFSIKISDDYTNMQSPFTVEWLKTGSGTPQPINDVRVNSDGEAALSIRYNAGEYTTRFRVKNAAGVWSDYRTISVQVNPAKQVSAVVEDPNDSGEYNETEEELTVRFKLTEAYEDSTLYAFLIPMDTVSSNLVVCKAFDTGIAIRSGDTESTGTAKIQLLDGTDETLPLTYSIALRTAKTWDAGETIGTYESKDLEIYINNVPPAVAAVNMSGSAPVTVNGGKFGGKASMGLNKIFTLDVEDVEADLEAPVTSVWTFSDPNGNAMTHTVVAPLDDISLTNVFEVAGVYTCTVKLQDKDMGKKKYGEVFTFLVEVLNTPSLSIVFPNSNTYNETDADKGLSYFYVDLSTPATKEIEVDIQCTKVGATGVLNITTTRVSYRPGQVRQQVIIDELDGTADSASFKGGFSVTAKVITEATNEDGIAYKAVYLPATEKMYVANEAPVIVQPFDTGATNDAPINVDIPLKWKIADVDFDLNDNLSITWITSEGDMFETNGTDVAEGVFTTKFKSGGDKTVTLTVMDKDGGSNRITLYYKVAASKQVYVYPMGPYDGGLTALSRRYASAAGIGEGRAWSSGSWDTEAFAHTYTYGATIVSTKISAEGYANGEADPNINQSGRKIQPGSGTPYVYTDYMNRDSFFYAWVIASKGGEDDKSNSYTASPLIAPVSPTAKSKTRDYQLSLPTKLEGEDKSNPMYLDSFIEAYFAKELYPADNMGEMNADGIPDYFATISWSMVTGESKSIAEAMTGSSISGENEGKEGKEEAATASDLTDVAVYNGDLDFFPAAWGSANPLNPTIKNWGPGFEFTAYDEIRGIGVGLNQPGVSDYDLTAAEKFALFADYAAANGTLTGTQEENYAAATNWAAQTRWTPEAVDPLTGARLNPLKADTDGDGFDDGWEYYFWYYAKVGAVVGGKWSRLEGRRFAPGTSEHVVRIAPEEIVKAFDPLSKRSVNELWGTDFDNDGLSDFEEYILGTNPISCDVEDDGVIELYKVMNGIDPASEFYNDGNPDCDFMARCDYAEDTFTVYTFDNGEIFALPTKTASTPVLAAMGETSSVVKVEFASGEVGWFAQAPVTIPGLDSTTVVLASDAVGYTSFTFDGVEYLAKAKVFGVGEVVKSIAGAATDLVQASVESFSWTNPETLRADTTAKALPLFNYGGDGVTYVPCVTNVSTYALTPTDSALVKIETEKTVTLIHNQVFCQYGFDPRTAWNIDAFGYVDQRWRKTDSSESAGLNATGIATNTVPYTTRDEFLVMQYRQQMRDIDKDGKRLANKSLLNNGDKYLLANKDIVYSVPYLQEATTYPNLPVSFVREAYANRSEVSPFDNSTNKTIVSYWTYLENDHNVHGADTDFDGVPDGWELYVNSDPNYTVDGKVRDGWANDGDDLCILEEYAGVDSCNAYTNRFSLTDPSKLIYPEATTITKNHPGKDKGWWNKFFPTNPFNQDTDGDGLKDDAEGKGGSTDFSVGNTWYGSQKFSFIYGDDQTAEKYSADGSSVCFRGGGLNPCTVDTDGDLLPDGWEYQFAGIVFKNGTTDVELSPADLTAITVADGKQEALTNTTVCIRGGMDGTFKGDANYDFDHDGLANWQEYLVQALRHLRYDDADTPLMGIDPTSKQFVKFVPFCAWDGEAFHKICLDSGFTGLATWRFRELGYFALPPHEWDMLRQTKKGIDDCANYKDFEGAGYRVMLPPVANIPLLGAKQASGYATTDPRRVDSDYDGMDDYWEIFHGLNPLLGSYANPLDSGEYGWLNSQYDRIAEIYGGLVTSWANHWTAWNTDSRPALDPVKHPWMMGVMEADADGDGLRNDEEAIKVNLAKPRNTHTDPTPLWMTDSSGKASYTAQYYNPDPYITGYTGSALDTYPDLLYYPWKDLTIKERLAADGMGGISLNWMFAFEENEGYDTDHDFRRDATELTQGVEMASDPLNHTDLDRRQALYFPGWSDDYKAGSAAISYGGEFRRSPSTEPDLLKQFTVECWVKPDGAQANVTILERVCDYGGSTLNLGDNVIRANFRLGINADGHAFGEFQGSTADSATARLTAPFALPVGEWTHVALRFDGKDAHLHLNGELAPVASAYAISFLPANGIDGIQQTPDQNVIALTGYRALPCATVLAASVKDSTAMKLNEMTTWKDFGNYFKGWIDEVRIWDGARSSTEIHEAYRKRFTMDDIKEMRTNKSGNGVYDVWKGGTATRANGFLPVELLQHYSFSTLPGGVEMGNVITEPTGFRSGVLDNVRKPNGDSLDIHTMVGWWYNTPVHSLVYWDYHVVPWLANTVAHMPFLDGSSPDSQFWANKIAGVNIAEEQGITAYDYPNTANPYPYYNYRRDRYNRLKLLSAVEGKAATTNTVAGGLIETVSEPPKLSTQWLFELRSGFVGTSDLVPLGLAYARRDASFWDDQGAMDAWTDTKDTSLGYADSDGDGIPDWAENLGIDTAEEYLRALAKGLLPSAKSKDEFIDAYKSIVDVNSDGLMDWWQKMYGLADSAQEDTDKDGLADFAEYLASEVFGFAEVSPVLPRTNGTELDYFCKAGSLYLGEMFSDHDFMEDHLEREYAGIKATPAKYDAHIDSDENGWSNWADIRSKIGMGTKTVQTGVERVPHIETFSAYGNFDIRYSDLLILEDAGEIEILTSYWNLMGNGYIYWNELKPVYETVCVYDDYGHPVPEIEMTVRYNGVAQFAGLPLTVQAYSDESLRQCDATFSVPNGDNRNVNTVTFKNPITGYLREGKNTFVVSVGAVSNVTATAGSIMGVVRNVDVGWSKVKFDVELTETSPICQRTTIPAGSTNDMGKVYVYRYSIDDVVTPPSSLDYGPVVVKDLGMRTEMHEGDFLAADDFDLDWSGFKAKVLNDSTVRAAELPVNKVVYRVYGKEVDLVREVEKTNTNKMPFVEIVREFGKNRATAVPVAPGEDSTIYYGGQPTFRWTVEGDRPDTYTAFAIKVVDASGEVWNSGTQMLPPKNSKGEYVWTAPLYAGDQTPLGKVFGSCANYKWSVTMYNSKFQSDSWSAERNFRVNIYGENEPNNAGYYALDVDVKYFGPGAFDADATKGKGKIRIEAFRSPDFSGVPAARTFMSDIANVTDSAHVKNVRIVGLAAGTYYVRAYIDSDGDFKRSAWESWGYACARGDKDTGAIYAPTGFTVGEGIETPFVSLYVEDTDVDQDALPDVWEYDAANGADDFLLKQGPMENTNDGYIAVNPDLVANIARVVAANSAGGMMSLAASGYMPSAMASMMLGVDSIEPEIEDGTLAVKSIALDGDNVNLTVGAAADEPAKGTIFVSEGKVTATIVVSYADTLGGTWDSTELTKTFEIEDGSVADTLTFSLSELGLDSSKGFFKVELK